MCWQCEEDLVKVVYRLMEIASATAHSQAKAAGASGHVGCRSQEARKTIIQFPPHHWAEHSLMKPLSSARFRPILPTFKQYIS